jgi:alanyl-tRNA synthetase
MTDRLYYHDSYLTEFRARVVDVSPDRQRIYLDRTAFYPTSGGQPFDVGQLGGSDVIEVVDEGERIAHVLSEPLAETEVDGRIDGDRRFDHMQQHTGQHLLSAVLLGMFDAPTVSFHLGAESSTIDISRALDSGQLLQAERRANQIVFENRPVTVSFQHSSEDLGLRKPTEREGQVRIISIRDLDRSACGGTHVRATG